MTNEQQQQAATASKDNGNSADHDVDHFAVLETRVCALEERGGSAVHLAALRDELDHRSRQLKRARKDIARLTKDHEQLAAAINATVAKLGEVHQAVEELAQTQATE